MDPVVVPIKSGSREPYEVTVWESGGTLLYKCTCPEQGESIDWCKHLKAVDVRETTMLYHPGDVGKLDEAHSLMRKYRQK